MAVVAPKNRIGRIAAPVLLVHGASDRFVPPSDMDVIFREANQRNTHRWLVPERRHSDVHLDVEFGPRVIDFLQGAIG